MRDKRTRRRGFFDLMRAGRGRDALLVWEKGERPTSRQTLSLMSPKRIDAAMKAAWGSAQGGSSSVRRATAEAETRAFSTAWLAVMRDSARLMNGRDGGIAKASGLTAEAFETACGKCRGEGSLAALRGLQELDRDAGGRRGIRASACWTSTGKIPEAGAEFAREDAKPGEAAEFAVNALSGGNVPGTRRAVEMLEKAREEGRLAEEVGRGWGDRLCRALSWLSSRGAKTDYEAAGRLLALGLEAERERDEKAEERLLTKTVEALIRCGLKEARLAWAKGESEEASWERFEETARAMFRLRMPKEAEIAIKGATEATRMALSNMEEERFGEERRRDASIETERERAKIKTKRWFAKAEAEMLSRTASGEGGATGEAAKRGRRI